MISSAFEHLMRAESLAARIEASCTAEPELGRLWRAEGAILEAVASVGLEGVRLDARDLLPRVAFNARGLAERSDAEAFDAERALKALLILKAPGNPYVDPDRCLNRLERLLGPSGATPWFDYPDESEEQTDKDEHKASPALSREVFQAALAMAHPSDPPILGALRVVSGWRSLSSRVEPLMERALFVAVEGALRAMATDPRARDRRLTPPAVSAKNDEDLALRGLSEPTHASWVALPGIALSRPSLREWDPTSPRGLANLLEGLTSSLSFELGRLMPLRAWLEKASAAGQDRTGRSRLGDATRAFESRPIMTASNLAQELGISVQAAMKICTELAALGLLGEVTHRRFARIWATPVIAQHLEPRAVAQRNRLVQEHASRAPAATPVKNLPQEQRDSTQVARDWNERKTASERRLDGIYANLDAALARADALLADKPKA